MPFTLCCTIQIYFSVSATIEKGASIILKRDAKRFRAPNGMEFNIKQLGPLFYLSSVSCHNDATTLVAQEYGVL